MALNLIKLQDDLKMMPNAQIIAYANGGNPMIPPFLALGELNRRKKLQDAFQAEQAKEMAGAPSVKEQIEQSVAPQAGIAGLQPQGMPQQAPQGMPQQAPQQPMMQAPMAPQAPVAQMAGGGFIGDYGTDFEGIASLPVPDNMYNEGNFAGGGIVAFSGETGSFVETSPGFYEMQDTQLDIDESKLSPYERMMLRELRQRRAEPGIAERRAAFGLPTEAPDTTARTRAELERRQRELEKEPDFFDRLLAIQPGRFGSGAVGRSVARFEQDRKAKLDDVMKLRAAAEDQRLAAEVAFKEGRFGEAERDRANANAFDVEAIKTMSGLAKDQAQIRQAEAAARAAGRPSDYQLQREAYLRHAREVGETPTEAGFQRFMLGAKASTVMTPEDAIRIAAQSLGQGARNVVISALAKELLSMAKSLGQPGSSGTPGGAPANRPPLSSFQR